MEVISKRCAGLDVHKRSVTACIRVVEPDGVRRELKTFRTFVGDLEALRDWLGREGIVVVSMESTGVYWKPVWRILEPEFELQLFNARHAKNVPGRKTDAKDAEWLAELTAHGLIAGSFVPGADQRALRELTRSRTKFIGARTQQVQRIDKVLEDTGIKLGSVASQTMGVSGRSMLEALIAGETNPEVLADLARGRLRSKIPELRLALRGAFGDHHRDLLGIHLRRYDDLGDGIAALDELIDTAIEPFVSHHERLCTIPGVNRICADIIIAEAGVDMTRFASPGHLASWAGLCPGHNESAGKQRSGRTTGGNPALRSTLTQSAWVNSRSKPNYLRSQFWNIAHRRGQRRAAIAVAHTILVIAFHILRDETTYTDLGADYLQKRNDRQQTQNLVNRLEALGHHVELTNPA